MAPETNEMPSQPPDYPRVGACPGHRPQRLPEHPAIATRAPGWLAANRVVHPDRCNGAAPCFGEKTGRPFTGDGAGGLL